MSKPIERRIIDARIEVRTNTDGSFGVHGYAAVFDSPSHGETVTRAAFNRTLAQRDNIRFLINHEGTPLASTRAGTMTVGVDDKGLWFDIPSLDPLNPRVQEFCSAVARGDMYQCSFAGYFRDSPMIDGVREVREVELIDVSGVTYPWYEDATMSLTGNNRADKALVAMRSLAAAERSDLISAALRAAPPGKVSYGDIAVELCEAIAAAIEAATGVSDVWLWIDDMGDDWAVYSLYDGDDWDFFQIAYTQTADGFTLGAPFQVERITEYRPLTPAEQAEEDAERSYTFAEARALLGLDPAA